MNSVIKGTGYVLVHAPDMLLHCGTTQTTEKIVNPDSEYLKELPNHLRSYEDVVAYMPNQTYIGNMTPDELATHEMPWVGKNMPNAQRYGKFGEIMPQDEFILLMQVCDVFDLVSLEKNFVAKTKPAFEADPVIDSTIVEKVAVGAELADIQKSVTDEHSEPIYHNGALVGCVKRAHDVDTNLSAHVMFENISCKASSVLAILHAVKSSGIAKDEVEYVIDCAEEACGDMNQRGGGNFAKAAAEVAGLSAASGSDLRGFCAAPAHALIEAAALVKSGAYKTVIVTAGGCTAKLGMNGKDHVKKDMPAIEDVMGGFAIVISENDGVSPEINLDLLGRHTVGTGSSPQNVITSLVVTALDRGNLKITDVDKYSVEMQNPDITKPAGAGDVPMANYKMIGALAAKRGEITPKDLNDFTLKHGMVGWAPTQGHIPSGAPYVGFCRDDIMSGKIKRAMVIGKGSLFLGRMTNLFDGVSFIIQPNSGANEQGAVSEEEVKNLIGKAMKSFAENLLASAE